MVLTRGAQDEKGRGSSPMEFLFGVTDAGVIQGVIDGACRASVRVIHPHQTALLGTSA